MAELPVDARRDQRRPLEILGLLVTVVTLFTGIYFSLRLEHKKALAVRYMAKLKLISPGAVPADKVTVSYGGNTIANLGKFSLQVVNSGDVPIEARDIEEPVSFRFAAGRILDVQISRTEPNGIKASVSHKDREATVKHGLLNPGDWIGIEILTDGQADWPDPQCRISGVPVPVPTYPNDPVAVENITLIPMPRPLQYACLVLEALAVLFGFVITIALLLDATGGAFVREGTIRATLNEVRDRVPADASQEVLKTNISNAVYRRLPTGPDQRAKEAIAAMVFQPTWDQAQTLEAASECLRRAVIPRGLKGRVGSMNWGTLAGAVLSFLLATAVFLLAGGSWRLLLGLSS